MRSITKNLRSFKDYFAGTIEIEDLHHLFQSYPYQSTEFEKDFYSTPINSSAEIMDAAIDLLLELNVNFSLWQEYFAQNLSLYSFLKEVARDHEYSVQLNQLVDLIIQKKLEDKIELAKSLTIGLALLFPVLMVALYNSAYQAVFHFLFDNANILPILGIGFSVIALVCMVYLNHLQDRRPRFKIFRDDFFLVSSSFFNTTGKVILVISSSNCAFLSAISFISATLIDSAREFWCLLELNKHYFKNPLLENNELEAIRQQHTRSEYDYIKQRNTLAINLTTALSLTALVIICSFLPDGVMLTFATCSSIASVYLVKMLALTLNKKIIDMQLQAELKKIHQSCEQHQINEEMLTRLKKTIHSANDSYISDNIKPSRKTRSLKKTASVSYEFNTKVLHSISPKYKTSHTSQT